MNSLTGKITEVRVHGNLSLVHIRVGDALLKSIVIETPATAPYLKTTNDVQVLFKETEVIIGKGSAHLVSLQNRLPCTIRRIDRGELLSRLTLQYADHEIVAVITTNATDQLALHTGEPVTAMIKTNEIMLAEV